MNEAEVAIVGGGPAGAALAIRLASAGREVVLFERLPAPRWRAAGVYSSPLSRLHLLALGLDAEQVGRLVQPISTMVIRTVAGEAQARLDYPAPLHACGLDRVRLERNLLDRAAATGARVLEGQPVRSVELEGQRPGLIVSAQDGPQAWRARLVVGADGPHSLVARSAGVARPLRRFRRAALTGHRLDRAAAPDGGALEAEMIVGDGWYLGVAPVPQRRVNLGLVLGEAELRRGLARLDTPAALLSRLLGEIVGPRSWTTADATDELQVCLPLAQRVSRAAGDNFLLVGDAAGFVDPLSGEGLQRAFASARLAARAIADWSRGEPDALAVYDRHLRRRYRPKDVLSWLLQAFLLDPRLTAHALRNLGQQADLRRTFALALADMLPASAALDPRFLARVLARPV